MLAVTGATGALGGRVAALLDDRMPYLVVRNALSLDVINMRIRRCSYGDGPAALSALEGVSTLFMVSAAESAARREEHRTFIDAAARAGVGHIVYTSFSGADPDATFTLGRDHADAEAAIRESGMDFTILRDNFYAEVVPILADTDGVIAGPAGEGRVAVVARADVADVAAVVMRDPAGHVGATYTLTGPEALSLSEAAGRAGAALGRSISYVEQSVEEAYAARRSAYPDAADWQLDAWVSTYTAIADGSVAATTDDVQRVARHAPRTLEDALTGE